MARHTGWRPKSHLSAVVMLAALPLVLSTSSVSLASDGPPTGAESPLTTVVAAPDATTGEDLVPTVVPASAPTVSRPAVVDVRVGDIPWAALQAYRRSAGILGEVEPSCSVSWTLLAAIGQVGSRHGQSGASELGDDGVARPDVVADPASSRRAAAADTDDGRWDGDADEDRAVGPMQLPPAVWDLAAVDGDGDGSRSPQDIDDAALATAVFLCASGSDLDTPAGLTAALGSLDESPVYVEQVLAVEKAYREGDFAVAGPPEVSTIGKLLSPGAGRPATLETARAVEKVASARDAARRPAIQVAARTPVDETAAPASHEPTPAPTDKPSAPAAEEPAAEEPVVEEPAAEEPAAEEPAAEEPAAEEPAAEEPPTEPTDAPVTEEPTTEPTDEPATEEPTEEPATEEPTEEPATEDPETVVVTGVWTVCDSASGWCLETPDGLLPLDLLGKTEDELGAVAGEEVRLRVLPGTEPLQVIEVLPPETD